MWGGTIRMSQVAAQHIAFVPARRKAVDHRRSSVVKLRCARSRAPGCGPVEGRLSPRPDMGRMWATAGRGPDVGQTRAGRGPDVGQTWARRGPDVGQTRAGRGPDVGQTRAGCRPDVARCRLWADLAEATDRGDEVADGEGLGEVLLGEQVPQRQQGGVGRGAAEGLAEGLGGGPAAAEGEAAGDGLGDRAAGLSCQPCWWGWGCLWGCRWGCCWCPRGRWGSRRGCWGRSGGCRRGGIAGGRCRGRRCRRVRGGRRGGRSRGAADLAGGR